MDMPLNSFKRAIKSGRLQVGLWSSLSSHVSVEIIAGSGFDWLLLDTEHSPNELPMVHGQLQAMVGGTAHPVVRPPWNDAVVLKRYLDMGVQSFLIPFVETPEEARAAVAATRYPPEGIRGVAMTSRATRFGRVKDYFAKAADEICVIVQIESQKGLDNIEAIAAVEGVDALFLGPSDLSAAVGHLGNAAHPVVQSTIEDAIRRIRAAGNIAGFLMPDEKFARRYIELGCLVAAVGSDLGILARQSEQIAARFKG
ncbi:MAG TPA: HpcH/HpaI aldolase/citrate lyase family protein [Geminicoccaceae bacterium]|nr:HpcH/HpaI aldolase/citrate lyase family protein [Geminicoccus sp.]HMU52786.1 HpcH/HpaI aldolase/citrate lyase family protein [Geminicoccaceae bacterium]